VLSEKDFTLLAGIAKGDSQCFKLLFDRYHGRLYALSFHMLRDSEKAKDTVQEVFIKVWNSREKIAVTSSLEAYLKRAVINATLNVIESNKRHTFMSILNPSTVTQLDQQRNTSLDDAAELQHSIDQAILKLPARTRAVFVLVRMEQMSYDEVSESLNISNKAVEKEMMKALRLLREQLRHFLTVSVIPTLAFILS
jgi:RNA polymerase sigma-70 factor (ECF subfamily)